MEQALACLAALRALVWGPGMTALLLGTGLWLTFRCGFPQLRLGRALRGVFTRPKEGSGLSPFQALCTALAGTVGTGNVAGVAGAILLGGPGAVFWMWVAAFFGMATKYTEIFLALRWRTRDADRRPFGGPMVAIERGLGPRFRPLGAAFALFGGLASFGVGNMTQSCEFTAAAGALFRIGPLPCGVLLAALVGAVLLGGLRRIGRMTELLVPLMAGLYVLLTLPVLIAHAAELPALLRLIVRSAFSLRAAGGGACGWTLREALRHGLSRGLFSNEAGLGSAPIAHAAVEGAEPSAQARLGLVEVLIDSFGVCTLTALSVLLSGVWCEGEAAFPTAGAAAAEAFRRLLPGGIGSAGVSLCLLFFALSSILGWAWYGEVCWGWLFRRSPKARRVFRLLFPLGCLAGALGPGDLFWELADVLNGLMALPNLIGLLLLTLPHPALDRTAARV